jgi:hypothetical protein
MRIYDIETSSTGEHVHSVVADCIAEAERIFLGKYCTTNIVSIHLHSEYVQIQKYDEQKK